MILLEQLVDSRIGEVYGLIEKDPRSTEAEKTLSDVLEKIEPLIDYPLFLELENAAYSIRAVENRIAYFIGLQDCSRLIQELQGQGVRENRTS